MKRTYNQSSAKRENAAPADPRFWEVPVGHGELDFFAAERHPYYESSEEATERAERGARAAALWPLLEKLVDERLTIRQRQVVRLYFIQGLTVYEISEKLDISAPSVSQHLFGKARGGRVVGGAIPKLRRLLGEALDAGPPG